MTPKEKAQELVDKFKEIIPAQYDQIDGGYDLLNLEFNARDCARIAVDEILNNWKDEASIQFPYGKVITYWNIVKEEIETL
jgi:hypothetical protein